MDESGDEQRTNRGRDDFRRCTGEWSRAVVSNNEDRSVHGERLVRRIAEIERSREKSSRLSTLFAKQKFLLRRVIDGSVRYC